MSVRRFRPHLFTRYRYFSTNDYQKRVEHLEALKPREQWYPRISSPCMSLKQYNQDFKALEKDETRSEVLSVAGRIQSIRKAGSKLAFVTIQEDEHSVQIVLKNLELLENFGIARKGDTYLFQGYAHRTARGQLSLLTERRPELLSPALHQIPEKLNDSEILAHKRHLQMLVDPEIRRVLRVRHTVERAIDDFLIERDFVRVTTPILQSGAGGAIARPFETRATELTGKKLHLRIAPELWLKRLIVGGMSRVYELGPVFRNEGVDATHNPEFTMCEFYAAHTSLQELILWTESLMSQISDRTGSDLPKGPYQQLEFLPTIEAKMGPLPKLDEPDAAEKIREVFTKQQIPIPDKPSLARLLDALAVHFIEPMCDQPTFITNHPAVLSPLAKCFQCPTTGQMVSARAELFIKHCEIANMYEEQNSPFEQAKAFEAQLRQRAIDQESDGSQEIDHGYVEALEYGLPPTGGWGCGVDRLVMLFSGRTRLSDVLSFGGLRNVVNVNAGK